ncbi:MAG: ATP-binding protein [Phycisphaerales bacterium]
MEAPTTEHTTGEPITRAAGLSETDLADLITSFNDVTRKLEGTHARLRAEVERLNVELRRANERLERSRRLAALGEMAAGIAHEIRNPLGSIGLYARLLEQDLADRPERKTAKKIRSAVSRLDEVVTDVLTFAREMKVDVAPADASDLLDRAVEGCRHVIGPVCRGDEARGSVRVACDEGLMVQALVNVVRNAAEACEQAGRKDAGITLDARTETDDEGAAWCVLSVRDAGDGIGPDVIDRMFNPFFTTRAAGTGLGLAIVHRIVDAHGGRVSVWNNAEHEPGAPGATFEMWVPLAGAGDVPSSTDDNERVAEIRVRSGMTPTRAA